MVLSYEDQQHQADNNLDFTRRNGGTNFLTLNDYINFMNNSNGEEGLLEEEDDLEEYRLYARKQ